MSLYRYTNVRTVSVHDGDTATFLLTSDPIDVGFGMTVTGATQAFSCRFLGYNARELNMPGGPEARAALAELLGGGEGLTVVSVKWDKYGGRFDGVVSNLLGTIAGQMIRAGWGAAWDDVGPKPVPPWPRVVPGVG